MATTRMAFGSILGTVTDTAEAVSNLVKTAGLGIGMINDFVADASLDQKDRGKVHRKVFRAALLRDSKLEVAKSNLDVLKFTRESDEHKALYEQAGELLDDVFDVAEAA